MGILYGTEYKVIIEKVFCSTEYTAYQRNNVLHRNCLKYAKGQNLQSLYSTDCNDRLSGSSLWWYIVTSIKEKFSQLLLLQLFHNLKKLIKIQNNTNFALNRITQLQNDQWTQSLCGTTVCITGDLLPTPNLYIWVLELKDTLRLVIMKKMFSSKCMN